MPIILSILYRIHLLVKCEGSSIILVFKTIFILSFGSILNSFTYSISNPYFSNYYLFMIHTHNNNSDCKFHKTGTPSPVLVFYITKEKAFKKRGIYHQNSNIVYVPALLHCLVPMYKGDYFIRLLFINLFLLV